MITVLEFDDAAFQMSHVSVWALMFPAHVFTDQHHHMGADLYLKDFITQ